MSGLNVSPIIHLYTYQHNASHVHGASIVCMDQCYSKAVKAVMHYCEMDKTLVIPMILMLVMMVPGINVDILATMGVVIKYILDLL